MSVRTKKGCSLFRELLISLEKVETVEICEYSLRHIPSCVGCWFASVGFTN